eukprot:TRINITY_DN10512_c0_g1_i1.p1 TRINITY_DN10512_c0_g1~~TRINITY_DN10512_c0_g1_i1.p1  ORF type:complete len:202 (-),score=46.10 TRINITY_DN10512_c0_g1_i1:456-1061(-)
MKMGCIFGEINIPNEIDKGYPPSYSSLDSKFIYKLNDGQWYDGSNKENINLSKDTAQYHFGKSITYDGKLEKHENEFGEKKIIKICVSGHSLVLLEDGTIFSDTNEGSYLSGGHKFRQIKLEEVEGLAEPNKKWVVAIACGYYFAYVVLSSGELIHFGQNNKDKFLHKESPKPSLIESKISIKSISCGSNHTVAVEKLNLF